MNGASNDHSLASWNEGSAKRAILDFVARVTRENSSDYVAPEDRVAVFDNDGTLWCEKPLPIQGDFMLRRIGEMARKDPALKQRQPWKAVAEQDYAWLTGAVTKHYHGDDSDLKQMAQGFLTEFEGLSVEAFEKKAGAFMQTAVHPTLQRPYLKCAYQPMIELLRFLEENGFENFIASGGGRDFMRPLTENLYGVPRERVIGSSVALEFRDDGKVADIFHKPDLDLFDDGVEKPVRIWSRIGRRPILAGGNSNGDIPMLRFTCDTSRPSMALLIDHDDEKREFSYQAGAEEALNRASEDGWTVVSIEKDWKTVFNEASPESADLAFANGVRMLVN